MTASLAIGAALLFTALAIAALELLGSPSDRPSEDRPRLGLAGISALAERTLARRGWQARLHGALVDAGLDLRPGDLCLLVAAGTGVGILLGLLAGNAPLAILLGVASPGGAHVLLTRRREARRRSLAEQVQQLLPSLAASLRAGHSLIQSVDLAGHELPAPLGQELRRVGAEVRLGRDLSAALESIAERYDCEDLRWIISAIEIHREVGGDLARVLDQVGETIRARDHLQRQVQSLTAEGRASAKVLTFLPVALGALLSVMNPSYLASFTGSPRGLVLLGMAVVFLLAGVAWLRSITKVAL